MNKSELFKVSGLPLNESSKGSSIHKQAVLNLFYKIMMLTIMIVIEISLLIIIIAHKNNNTIFNKAKMCI